MIFVKLNYWENHYKTGGRSTEGTINESREWKLDVLQEYGLNHNVSVIDIGCGDMEFWQTYRLKQYTGIDISPSIIINNKKKYPRYNFYCNNSSNALNISADYVICFDVLFHIMDTTQYIMTLLNLKYYTQKKLFIYTWQKNPFGNFKNRLLIGKPFAKNMVTDGKFQYYREFDAYSIRYLEDELKLIGVRSDDRWPYGAIYIYERQKQTE